MREKSRQWPILYNGSDGDLNYLSENKPGKPGVVIPPRSGDPVSHQEK